MVHKDDTHKKTSNHLGLIEHATPHVELDLSMQVQEMNVHLNSDDEIVVEEEEMKREPSPSV